jgi:hypothetical protein
MHAAPKSELHPIIQPEKLAEYDAFLPWNSHSIWQYTSTVEGILGQHKRPMENRRSLGQVCRGVHFHRDIRRWSRGYRYCDDEYTCPPWDQLPLGYKNTLQFLGSLDEVHGGSAWGAGTLVSGAALTFDIVIYVADVLEIGWTRITSTQPAGDPAR